jgi:predicted nucleic acid-binding protein
MFILDTNVISELMRAKPDDNVLRWANSVDTDEFATTAICEAEILYGLAIMPDGKRRSELEEGAKLMFEQKLARRVFPFDSAAAEFYARLRAHQTAIGRPMKEPDAQIAAISAVHSGILVTRNISDFDHVSLELINPWAD